MIVLCNFLSVADASSLKEITNDSIFDGNIMAQALNNDFYMTLQDEEVKGSGLDID